jgi:hypothetical protein
VTARDPHRDAAWREALAIAEAIRKPPRKGRRCRRPTGYRRVYFTTLWRSYLERYYAGRLERAGYRPEVVLAARRMGVGDEVIRAALAREEAA